MSTQDTPVDPPLIRGTLTPHGRPPRDRARQWTVAASAVIGVALAFLGSGAVVGTPVAEVADGALSATATLVAPARQAFAIWGVIYTGLLLLAVLQLAPSRREDPRQRRVGWLVSASLLLNGAWVVVVQLEWLLVSVVLIIALLVVLVVALRRLDERRASTRYEAVVVDGSMGLYLGWVCIATVANSAATLVFLGADPLGSAATAWALTVCTVAGGVGVLLAVGLHGRLAPALGLAWGLLWLAVGRASDLPQSTSTAVAAGIAAAVTLISALVVRSRGRRPT